MKHRLWTPAECQADRPHDPDATNCPVCDWGLGVCKICGQAEVELSGHPKCIEKLPEPASIEGDVAYQLVEKVNELIDWINQNGAA